MVPRRVLATCFLIALANFTFLYCHLYVIMYSFAPDIKPQAVGLFPLITIVSRAVPSIAGLGVREFVAGWLFAGAEYNVGSAAAVVASSGQFVILNVLPAVIWLVTTGGFGRFFRKKREEQ
jgi:uncharacterized membrane protein YbhN (UPF0104 family)